MSLQVRDELINFWRVVDLGLQPSIEGVGRLIEGGVGEAIALRFYASGGDLARALAAPAS